MSSSHSHASSSRRGVQVATATLAFVLTLCLPYASASPVQPPSADISVETSLSNPAASSHVVRSIMVNTLSTISSIAKRQLYSDDTDQTSRTILTSSLSRDRPLFGLAYVDVYGNYRLPDNYVILVQRFNPGFIVLSYAIAFVGSLCTLELLIRRTTNAGWRNQALLASAGVTFGAVSTFAMHFIFNNSLSLHHPNQHRKNYPSLRLAYDPGFTVLSLIVSCLAMTIAFFIMGSTIQDWWCLPGVRRRSRSGSTASEIYKHDDYKNGKDSHKKVLRRGTLGVGALLHRAGTAAKWSMMDMPGDEKSAANARWNADQDSELKPSHGIKMDSLNPQDKNAQELEFRLGKSGAIDYTGQRDPAMPNSLADSAVASTTSDASPPGENIKTFATPTRRNSASMIDHAEPGVFQQNFDFSAKPDEATSSTANLIPSSTLVRNTWSDVEIANTASDSNRRRASLPAVSLTRDLPARQPITLSRIQSLPEGDADVPPVTPDDIYDKNSSDAKSFPTFETIQSTRGTVSSSKRVNFKERPVFSKAEKFLGFDVVTMSEIIKIVITGTVAGFGVVAMHYIGQLSITGLPYIAYKPGYVIGSVVIAAGAVVIALYIMFIMLRPKLKHTWASKIVVAMILAVAVCGMHFCGMRGTIYAWPTGTGIKPSEMLTGTNKVITAVVAALAFLACIACGVFFVLHSLKLRRERARRRRVVVAAVLIDPSDRILVSSTDGMLPMCDIASLSGNGETMSSRRSMRSHPASFSSDSTVLGMDLSTGHEAFVSAMKISWGWRQPGMQLSSASTPEDLNLRGINSHNTGTLTDGRRGSLVTMESNVTGTGRAVRLSVAKFLERFSTSSNQLAVQLLGSTDGLSRLGVLYDQILTTGWVKLSKSNDTVSKGQLIFLVRRVNSSVERNDLLTKAFIFADAEAVATTLHKTLSVPFDHTVPLLEDIRMFCDSTLHPTLKQGMIYAGVTIVQATPFDGLRILLEQDNRAQLPMRELCPIDGSDHPDGLNGSIEEIAEALTWLEGMSLMAIITRNMSGLPVPGGERVSQLLAALERTLVPMLDEILDDEDITHLLPRLLIYPALVPLTPGSARRDAKTGYIPPYLIVFYANYDAAANTFTDKWLPFSLFRAQNACVMAPRIAAAARIEQAFHTASHMTSGTDTQSEEYEYTRRPSRVQFDFPSAPSAMTPSSPVTIPPAPPITGGMFGGFSFPPKTEQTPMSPTQPTHLTSIFTQPISVASRRTLGTNAPRRSSLAPRSRFGSDAADLMGGKDNESIPGLDEWEQDWLLTLLRTKLRAEF